MCCKPFFGLRDPLHLKLVTSFTDMAGLHASSLLRKAPQRACAGHAPDAHHGTSAEPTGKTQDLVEIDDQGKVSRSASNADPVFAGALLTRYGLVVLPEIDH